MAPQRPEDGFVRMPDAEFEAILTRATEVGQLWCQVSLAEIAEFDRLCLRRLSQATLIGRFMKASISQPN